MHLVIKLQITNLLSHTDTPKGVRSADAFQLFLPIYALRVFEGVADCRAHGGGFLTSVLFSFGLILTGRMLTKSCICFFMAQISNLNVKLGKAKW